MIDAEWLRQALAERVAAINWKEAVVDVERFLNPMEQRSLSLWSEKFFMDKIQKFIS